MKQSFKSWKIRWFFHKPGNIALQNLSLREYALNGSRVCTSNLVRKPTNWFLNSLKVFEERTRIFPVNFIMRRNKSLKNSRPNVFVVGENKLRVCAALNGSPTLQQKSCTRFASSYKGACTEGVRIASGFSLPNHGRAGFKTYIRFKTYAHTVSKKVH